MAVPVDLGAELQRRAGEDTSLRSVAARKGRLARDYHPRLRALHEANADWLNARLDEGFWPVDGVVSLAAIGAFWQIVQHAISRPGLMRRVRDLAGAVADAPHPPAPRASRRQDRRAGGPTADLRQPTAQDEAGNLSPAPIGDAAHVDERRRSAGLMPLAEELVRQRVRAAADGDRPPRRYDEYIAAREAPSPAGGLARLISRRQPPVAPQPACAWRDRGRTRSL